MARKLNPEYAWASIQRARIFQARREHALAIPELDRALNTEPRNPVAFYLRALSHIHLKREKQARADLKASCDIGLKRACNALELWSRGKAPKQKKPDSRGKE